VARSPLVPIAAAFIGAVLADANGFALGALVAALVAFALRPARPAAFAAVGGLAVAAWFGHPAMLTAESRTGRFAGTIVGDVRAGEAGTTFAFALRNGMVLEAHLYGPAAARAHGAPPAVAAGERLEVRGRLVPFDEARNPGEPSRRALGLAEGVAGELIVARILARAPPDPRDVRAWPARLRAFLSARLRGTMPEPEATILAGALWGERGTLPAALRDAFQATGTVHILVTAGLHLGVIAALIFGMLRLAGLRRAAASFGTIPAVIAYAWLTGAHLPSQRAAVMVSVALLARGCGARAASWNALALAALVVAALWPASVSSVSFALSFSCVGAILLFAEPVARGLERWKLPERVREALSLTVATQIGVWPLSAATFGLVAPYAIVANAIVVPATMLALPAGIATLACANVATLDGVTATTATWIVDVILRAVATVAALPGAHVRVAPPPAGAIVAYDVAAIIAAQLLGRRTRLAAALLVLASVGVLATTLRLPDGKLTITMLDVGQGDGIVIRTPRGHTILIDSGGRLERGAAVDGKSPAEIAGERIVLGYLQREGIHSVDLLVITHPHGDHAGGCAPIVRALRVAAIADSGQHYGGRAYVDCQAAAHEAAVPVRVVRAGTRWGTDDGVVLDVLAPSEPLLADTGDDVNENSIVLRLSYALRGGRTYRVLLTGDAGEGSEARLLARPADLRADLLKVGHHGSRWATTADFLAAVRPRIALISVGRHNSFGHPSPETLARLNAAGVTVYRTDRCGAITLRVDPEYVTPMLRCDPGSPGTTS
jgi:competence protein ComEC